MTTENKKLNDSPKMDQSIVVSEAFFRFQVENLFYKSTAFRVAVAMALLGGVLIGVVSISSSWINFTAADTLTKTKAETIALTDALNNAKSNYDGIEKKFEALNASAEQEAAKRDDELKKATASLAKAADEEKDKLMRASSAAVSSIPNQIHDILTANENNLVGIFVKEQQESINRFHNDIINIENEYKQEIRDQLARVANKTDSNIDIKNNAGWQTIVKNKYSSISNYTYLLVLVVGLVVIGGVIWIFFGK